MHPSQPVLDQYRARRREREQGFDIGLSSVTRPSDEDLLSQVRLKLEKNVAPSSRTYLDQLVKDWNRQVEDVFYVFDGIVYKSAPFLRTVIEIFAKLNSWEKGLELLRRTKDFKNKVQWSSRIAKSALDSIATEASCARKAGRNENDHDQVVHRNQAGPAYVSTLSASRTTGSTPTGFSVTSGGRKRSNNDDDDANSSVAKKARLERHKSAEEGRNDVLRAASGEEDVSWVASKARQSSASAEPASFDLHTDKDADHHIPRSPSRLGATSLPSVVRLRPSQPGHISYTAASRPIHPSSDGVPDLGASKSRLGPSRSKEAEGSEAEKLHGTRCDEGESSGSLKKSPVPKVSLIGVPYIDVDSLPDQSPTMANDAGRNTVLRHIHGLADDDAWSLEQLTSGGWLGDHFVNTVIDVFNPDPTTWYTVESLTFDFELAHAKQRPNAPALFCQRKVIFPMFTGVH